MTVDEQKQKRCFISIFSTGSLYFRLGNLWGFFSICLIKAKRKFKRKKYAHVLIPCYLMSHSYNSSNYLPYSSWWENTVLVAMTLQCKVKEQGLLSPGYLWTHAISCLPVWETSLHILLFVSQNIVFQCQRNRVTLTVEGE